MAIKKQTADVLRLALRCEISGNGADIFMNNEPLTAEQKIGWAEAISARYIEPDLNNKDRRILKYYLTDEGRRALNKHDNYQ